MFELSLLLTHWRCEMSVPCVQDFFFPKEESALIRIRRISHILECSRFSHCTITFAEHFEFTETLKCGASSQILE